ncbi:MAG: hypothetical protein ACR2P3_12305 [Geminicoccaceae bacterium]
MKRATEKDKETITDLRERGWSVNRIAGRLTLTPSTVQYWANKLGAWPEGRKPPKPKARKPFTRNGRIVRPFTKAEDAKILAMRLDGVSLSAIGREVERPHNSIANRLDQLSLWAESETV